jgi:hypothetical protein
MICNICAEAADYDYQPRHNDCEGCDCRHKPLVGEQRLKWSDVNWPGTSGPCNVCGKVVAFKKDGTLRKHRVMTGAPYCAGIYPTYVGGGVNEGR